MKGLVLLSFLALTSCAAYQAQSQINTMSEAEFGAWEQVTKLNQEQCLQGTDKKPVPRSKALEKYSCWEKLVREHVAPAAMAPDLLLKVIVDTKQISLNYKKGKIDRDEANLAGQKLHAEYYAALDARARNALMNAQQQDQAFAQRLQNASQQMNQAEIERQKALQANSPKNTNCRVWNDTMNCTTW